MTNTTHDTQELDMTLVAEEISGLSSATRHFFNENFSSFMISEEGTLVNRPPRAGARRAVVRPTDNDRLVMDTLIRTEIVNASILRNMTNLSKSELASSLKYLTDCSFINLLGNGPGRTYSAATQNPVYPEHKQAPSRRSGPKTGPTARSAFITALNEVEPGSEFTLAVIRDRTIELFPNSNFRPTSFGAIPSQLVENGYIVAEGNGRNRSFIMGANIIPGGVEVPMMAHTTQTIDSEMDISAEDQDILSSGLGD